MRPEIVPIEFLPPPEPSVSSAHVITSGSRVAIVYACKGKDWPSSELWAAAVLDGCWTFLGGSPNDEAFHNHPMHASGLEVCAIQEIRNSPWIIDRARIADRDGNVERLLGRSRHFVFAMKETTIECIAASCSNLGVFANFKGAWSAGCSELGL